MTRVFISYSHQDEAWKDRVVCQLDVLADEGLESWDDRRIEAGDNWLPEIEAAIAGCDVALLLVSAHFLTSGFIKRQEVPALLTRREQEGLRVIPLILSPCPWNRVGWLKSMQARPKDGKPLSRMGKEKAEEALSHLAGEVHDFIIGAPFPEATRSPSPSPRLRGEGWGEGPTVKVDITHLPSGAPHFLGRTEELAELDAAWASNGKTPIVELIAPGGTGKTALAKRWVDNLRSDGWRGARRVFAWSFYSQGTSDDRQASEDHFLGEALKWFGVTIAESANPADKGRALAEELARSRTLLVLDGLEPLQYPPGPLAGELRAPRVKTLLAHAASTTRPGLILLTSREWLKDLDEWVRNASHPAGPVLRHDLGNLSPADGARLLHAEGARRAGDAAIEPEDKELQSASVEVKGHALTLTLLARYLALAFEGDIRRRIEVKFQEADAQTTRGHAFRVIQAYERWFQSQGRASELAALRLLGFFDRPASKANLAALTAQPAIPGLTEALAGHAPAQWRASLKRLEDCRLIEPVPETGGLDAHPLVREYFAAALAQGQPAAWQEGHRRLYEQLKRDTPHRPDTLAGLQALYQAVAHGCKAGLAQEVLYQVYVDRILRGTGHDGFYSSRKLGAIGADLGAIACFFMEPWRRLAPELKEGDQAWLLNQAAFRLRALGRLAEALEPMRVGAEMRVRQEDWKNAAASYNNLGELELSLGRVKEAVADAGRSVDYADLSGDAFQRMSKRTTLADARHQQGKLEAARQGFVEAEAMQAKVQPQYPLLYSLQGFRYCELLLAPAERASWGGLQPAKSAQMVSNGGLKPAPQAVADVARRSEASPGPGSVRVPSPGPAAAPPVDARTRLEASSELRVCAEVAKRAAQTLRWIEDYGVDTLSSALDHLTLARCALYSDLLQGLDRKSTRLNSSHRLTSRMPSSA
jgi:tetratricopeptide (TPR) repeat protein